MSRPTVVFLGPSAALELARQHLPDALYRPPVAMGDVYHAVESLEPWAIGIIDGFFEQQPAVWHKEILYALHRGVRVYGAASMGALRAAELGSEGMTGVGEIFGAFARGELEDDDEVAVAHASSEHGYRPLSDAMVEIRAVLRALLDAGSIDDEELRVVVGIAKALHYAERRWPAILQAARGKVRGEALDSIEAQLESPGLRLKTRDALTLLVRLKEDREADVPRNPSPRGFEASSFWHLMVRECRQRAGSSSAVEAGAAPSFQELFEQVSVLPDRDALFAGALRSLRSAPGAREDVPPVEREHALDRLRRELRLKTERDVARFRQENHVGEDELTSILEDSVARERDLALARREPAFRRLLLLELKRSGRFASVAAAIDVCRTLSETGVAPTSAETSAAVEWYQSSVRWVGASLKAHADELGISGASALISRIVALYRCRSKTV